MIAATDALMLPSAQLSEAEQLAAAALEVAISAYVETHMERRGCHDFKTKETRNAVVAEVNQRLRRSGWFAEWKPFYRQDSADKQKRTHAGYMIDLIPTDEAYREADARRVN